MLLKFWARRLHRMRSWWRPTFYRDAIHDFQVSVLLLLALFVVGTIGYMQIDQMVFTDALYMTVITLTTVGYGETQPLSTEGRWFTMLLIILGVSATANSIQKAATVIIGDHLWLSFGERDMSKRLATISGHFIVCGYGRMGREITNELKRHRESFVIIDQNEELHTIFLEEDILHVIGDATHDEILIDAGIRRAKGLLSVVDTDADNVLIVLSAKGLNPQIKVVSRAATDEMAKKLKRAGADHVTSPYVIGGQRMAFALMRPAVYDFLNNVVYSEQLDSEMGQITIHADSSLVGTTLRQAALRQKWGVIVLAIVDQKGQTFISPDPNRTLHEGDTLILVATQEKIFELEHHRGPIG